MLYSLAVLMMIGFAQAIYPSDHFDYSTKLTVDTFDEQVKSAVDSGKTLMVRWIASAG
jgi:hypothetical protein